MGQVVRFQWRSWQRHQRQPQEVRQLPRRQTRPTVLWRPWRKANDGWARSEHPTVNALKHLGHCDEEPQ